MGTLAEGIKEIFATAKTTGSNVMLCGNDGTPDGHMTMANLASVLGGAFKNRSDTNGLVPYLGNIRVINKEQIDALTFASGTYGFYKFTGYNSSLVEADDGLLLVCYNFMLKYGADGKMAFRTMSSTTWHYVGYDIPSFYKNYNDLSSLASALGVLVNGTLILSGTFSDITKSGIYGYNHDSYTASDEPANYGVLMVFNGSTAGSGNPIAQMFFANNGTIYTRIKSAWNGNDYTAWRTISFT